MLGIKKADFGMEQTKRSKTAERRYKSEKE